MKDQLLRYIEYLRELATHDRPLAADAPTNTFDAGWNCALDYMQAEIEKLTN
jgi:hypothetical protein